MPTGSFMLLCVVGLVRSIAGKPLIITLGLPATKVDGPMIVGCATPAWSPVVSGMIDARLSAGIIVRSTFGENDAAIAFIATFGYGTGTTAGPAGVRQTSGKPRFIPAPRFEAGSIA